MIKIFDYLKSHKVFISLFLISFAYYLLWGLAFYPGIMTNDSLGQWSQAHQSFYDDWFPYLHTLIYFFTSKIWDSPFLPVLLQILYTSLSIAFINSFLYRNIKQKRLVIILALLQIFSSSIAIYTITLWKDIFFSVSLVNLAFYSLYIYPKTNLNYKNYLVFTFLFITTAFFRHNGVIFLALIPLLFLILKRLRVAVTLGAISVTLYMLISILLFNLLNVNPNPFWVKDTFVFHGMAGFYVHGVLTDNAKANLESVLPQDQLYLYAPDKFDSLFFNKNLNKDRFNSQEFWAELNKEFYGNALWNNFGHFVKQRLILINSSLSADSYLYQNEIVPNALDLKTDSQIPFLKDTFNSLLQVSEQPIFKIYFWNFYPPVLIMLALSILSIIKNHYRFLIFAFIFLIQIPFLFLLSPGSDWRFFYFIYFGGFFAIPIYLFVAQSDKSDPNRNTIIKNKVKQILIRFKLNWLLQIFKLILRVYREFRQLSEKILMRLKIINNDLKKYIKNYIRDRKAQQYKKKIETLARQIPDSNGSSYYKKLKLNVAIISNEFMFDYYKDAVNLFGVNETNYQDIFRNNKIDILLYVTYPDEINSDYMKNVTILKYAKRKGIVTIFQSITDPINYNMFLPIAKSADYIFTADEMMVPQYKKDTGNNNVHSLAYGINPIIHNPIGFRLKNQNKWEINNSVFLAGSWDNNSEEVCNNTLQIFNGVIKSNLDLVISDNKYNPTNKTFSYPETYSANVIPAIDKKLLAKVCKLFDWNINLNRTKYSSSICDMGPYELQSLGVLNLSNYAISVFNTFPNIFLIHDENEVVNILSGYNQPTIYEMQVNGIRNIFSGNTVFERLRYMTEIIGIELENTDAKEVTVVCKQKNPKIIDMFEKQTYTYKKLLTLAELKEVKDQFITFFSVDNDYSDYYLEDMINAFKYTDVAYVTKASSYNLEGDLIGVDHNYVNQTNDKYKTVFNLEKLTLQEIIEQDNFESLGYSIDPFELNVKPIVAINDSKKELGVIIAVYNNGSFLTGKAFSSLLRSTIFDKMHIYLVDDGSTDKETIRIVDRLIKKYPNVSYYNFNDGGSGSASRPRNKGVEICDEEYLTYLDPDNEAINDGYASLLDAIKKDNYDMAFGYCIALVDHIKYEAKNFWGELIIKEPKKCLLENTYFVQSVQACVIKKSFIEKHGLENVVGALGEDTLFFYELMLNAETVIYKDIGIHIYYAERQGSSVNNISKSFFEKSYKLEKEQVRRFRNYNIIENYIQNRYQSFMNGWYGLKLIKVKDSDIIESVRILEKIAELYGKKIDEEYLNKYLPSNTRKE